MIELFKHISPFSSCQELYFQELIQLIPSALHLATLLAIPQQFDLVISSHWLKVPPLIVVSRVLLHFLDDQNTNKVKNAYVI